MSKHGTSFPVISTSPKYLDKPHRMAVFRKVNGSSRIVLIFESHDGERYFFSWIRNICISIWGQLGRCSNGEQKSTSVAQKIAVTLNFPDGLIYEFIDVYSSSQNYGDEKWLPPKIRFLEMTSYVGNFPLNHGMKASPVSMSHLFRCNKKVGNLTPGAAEVANRATTTEDVECWIGSGYCRRCSCC